MGAQQEKRFPADEAELLLTQEAALKTQSRVGCPLSANKMACAALFHEVVSKATEDLVSSCRRTMIYSDFVFPSPRGKQ